MDNKVLTTVTKSQLHKKISSILRSNIQFPNCGLYESIECGGQHNIPLFCSNEKGNATEFCNVDLLIIKNDKIKVIIEIEESDIKPTQICGKYLTSAMSLYFIHESKRNIPIGMDNSVMFIQILDTAKLADKSSKLEQFRNIEQQIKKRIPIKDSKIDKYKIFIGDLSYFNGRGESEIVDTIKEVLK